MRESELREKVYKGTMKSNKNRGSELAFSVERLAFSVERLALSVER